MPGTGDAAIDDPAFADRPTLMSTSIADRGQSILVSEDRDPSMSADGDHLGAIHRDLVG